MFRLITFVVIISILGCASSNVSRPSFKGYDSSGKYESRYSSSKKSNNSSTSTSSQYSQQSLNTSSTNTPSSNKRNVSKSSGSTQKIYSNKSGVSNLDNVVYKYIGVRYKYGGTTPNGFDCSGFVWKVYQELGYSFGRTNVAHLLNMGQKVSRSNLRKGDLVFFKINGRVSHVGIYTGDNKFIHASSSRGVIESSLDNSYWKGKIYQFRRLF